MTRTDDAPSVDELIEVCRDELEALWEDLADAVDTAIGGGWSIRCGALADRIRRLTLLVGPTRWRAVPISLLTSGVYQRLHDEMGIVVRPDMAVVDQIVRDHTSRAAPRPSPRSGQ